MADRKSVQRDTRNGAAELTIAPPRVYVAGDIRLFREGLNEILIQQGELKVVGQGSCADTLAEIGTLQPDIVLLDYTVANRRFFCRQLHLIIPDLRVVAVAVAELDADIIACAEAGISEYVPREASVEELVRAVMRALAGEVFCSPRVTALLFARLSSLSAGRPEELTDSRLTQRERDVAALVACGLPNKEVARRLCLGNSTVKNHVHNILQKLNLQRRAEIAGLRIVAEMRLSKRIGSCSDRHQHSA